MRMILLDADAFLTLRSHGMLDVMRSIEPRPSIVITGYVARHELSTVQPDLEALIACGSVREVKVGLRTDAGRLYRELQRRAHKGEAELVAWASTAAEKDALLMVSNDGGARRLAGEYGLSAGDVVDLLIELLDAAAITIDDAEARFAPWADRGRRSERPSDYVTSLRETISRRTGGRLG